MFKESCDSTHTMTSLSIVSAVVCGLFLTMTVPLNGVILWCLCKNVSSNKAKYKLFFYKIIINVAIADLMKGLFADTSALVWHIRETLGVGNRHKELDVPFVHVSMFVTDGVALVSMVVLSFERIMALVAPHRQFKRRTQLIILLASWPISVCILLPYISVGFLTELIIFFSCTNSVAVVSLILLTTIYRIKFKAPYTRSRHSDSMTNSTTNLSGFTNDTTFTTEITVTTNKDVKDEVKEITDEDKNIKETKVENIENGNHHHHQSSTSSNNNNNNKIRFPIQLKRICSVPNISCSNSTSNKKRKGSSSTTEYNLSGETNAGSTPTTFSQFLHQADPIDVRIMEQNTVVTSRSRADVTNIRSGGAETEQSRQQQQRKKKRSTSMTNIAILTAPFQRSSSSSSSMRAKQSKKERKVTLAFLKMLLVFIVTYLPTLVMVICLNIPNIKCDTIHIFRDISVLGILSSSLFRAVNFIATLKHVRKSIRKTLCRRQQRRKR